MEKNILSGVVGGVIAALVVVFVSFSFFGGSGEINAGSANRLPNGYFDVGDGYYVDGTAIIDGSGNFTGGGTGAFSTLSASGLATLNAGQLRSYTKATSTTDTTTPLLQADIANYDTISVTPNTADLTYTFPASSTITTFIPNAGDMAEQCWHNATGTAGIDVIFAAGTGIDLETASSSATDLTLLAGNSACFKYIRKANTDISVLMTEFMNAD